MDSEEIKELDARYLAVGAEGPVLPARDRERGGLPDHRRRAGVTRLDFTAGWAVANLGYGNSRVREAVDGPVRPHLVRDPDRHDERTERPARASGWPRCVPGDFEKKVWYGLHGSDANDCLAKLVPLATGRQADDLVHRRLPRPDRGLGRR